MKGIYKINIPEFLQEDINLKKQSGAEMAFVGIAPGGCPIDGQVLKHFVGKSNIDDVMAMTQKSIQNIDGSEWLYSKTFDNKAEYKFLRPLETVEGVIEAYCYGKAILFGDTVYALILRAPNQDREEIRDLFKNITDTFDIEGTKKVEELTEKTLLLKFIRPWALGVFTLLLFFSSVLGGKHTMTGNKAFDVFLFFSPIGGAFGVLWGCFLIGLFVAIMNGLGVEIKINPFHIYFGKK